MIVHRDEQLLVTSQSHDRLTIRAVAMRAGYYIGKP